MKIIKNLFHKIMNCDTSKKSEIQIRMEIISIIDPLKKNSEYCTMTIDQLNEILKKKTNNLGNISHDQYQSIYDLPVDMSSRSTEIAILEFRISNLTFKLKELSDINGNLEEELIKSHVEIEKLKKIKTSKNATPEPGSFAAFVENQENEAFNGSKSPSNRQEYPSYTPRRITEFPDQKLFAPINNFKTVNGNLNEQDAILLAIKESEILANKPLDTPFNGESSSNTKPISNTIPWRENDNRYQNLKDRPSGATTAILDRIYDYLILRDFDSVKTMLNTELSPEIVRWIRSLSYDGSNFKQMSVTKSLSIHKVFYGDN